MLKCLPHIRLLALIMFLALAGRALAQDAQAVVQGAFDYMRDKASVCLVEMTIKRPDWQRAMTLKAWTKGQTDSIFYILSPPKDEGNGTLKKDREMWMYNPKVNRVIKLPPSMMSQAWMGSDFSNNDLSKTDSILKDYDHSLISTETAAGQKVYVIKSMPKPQAPVIWGMQKLKVREDHLFLYQGFFDEDLKLVKELDFLDLKMMGGKLYPATWKMKKAGATDSYTVVTYKELEFKPTLPDNLFTLEALRNPRR